MTKSAELRRLLRNYSAEVTAGDSKSIEAACSQMAPGTEVYVASLATDRSEQQLAAAVRLRRSGLTPVPHIVARNLASEVELNSIIEKLVNEAGVDRALVLGGDRDTSAGPFLSSYELLETGVFNRHGIRKVALSWYPEGHPRIPAGAMQEARSRKLDYAKRSGLTVKLVSQFCFEAQPILQTAALIRAEGVAAPLWVGIAGPASRTSLLKYAMICGVGASVRALKERPGARSLLWGSETPIELLEEIARAQAADAELGIAGIHFFTFAGLAKTIQLVNELTEEGTHA